MFLFTDTTQAAGSGSVRSAIQQASDRTGVTFDYLLSTAQRESNFAVSAQAKDSSARGLFQFIESTWLATLRDSGAALGYSDYADKIATDRSGRPVVTDPSARAEILQLRDDPHAAAMMAGALARQNGEALRATLGREPQAGELYLAHFLGAQGAVNMIALADQAPAAPAAKAFPEAARANRSIFYDGAGAPRSAIDVYRALTSLPQVDPAAAGEAAPAPAGSSLFTARQTPDRPLYSLFSDSSRGMGPIAGAIAALWQPDEPQASQQISSEASPQTSLQAAAGTVPSPSPTRAAVAASAGGGDPHGAVRQALLLNDGLPFDVTPPAPGAAEAPGEAVRLRAARTYP